MIEELFMDQQNPPPSAGDHVADRADRVRAYIGEHSEELLQGCVVMLQRRGRRTGRFVDWSEEANELLNEMTIEAIAHAQGYDPTRQMGAWLLGIVVNLVKRHNAVKKRHDDHEADVEKMRLARGNQGVMELFETLAEDARRRDDPSQISAKLADILDQAQPEDREILIQIDLNGWDYEALAHRSGVSVGTLRKRHWRALQRVQHSARQNGGQ
jgi:RNA polymerase sigma factor (sigma-70 family)